MIYFLYFCSNSVIDNMKWIRFVLLLMLCGTVLSACKSDDDEGGTVTTKVDEDDDSASAASDTYEYQLPVIFHVLYQDKNDALQYVPASRLKEILTYVNEIWDGNVYGESEDVNVSFNLAQYDESGNKLATPGVEYVYYSGTYPIDPDEFMMDQTGKNVKYIWDPNEYINVLVYNFAEGDDGSVTLGISHLPYITEADGAIEGCNSTTYTRMTKSNLKYAYCSSINSTYINTESTRYTTDRGSETYTLYSADICVTLAHELGHYLGLYHMFSEDENSEMIDSCADSDYCEDTPSYNRVEYLNFLTDYYNNTADEDFSLWTLLERTNCDNELYYSANIMDYTWTLGYKISTDQRTRIRYVLNYSPLIPGPKRTTTTRASREAPEGAIDLPVKTAR